MRVRNYKNEDSSEINSKAPKLYGNRSKFSTSTERKIESLRFQSKQLGWSYSDFVVRLLEILVVLNHRNRVRAATQRKINTDI
jgi:hypothetical protein